MTTEVKQGLLIVNGRELPLRKGLVLRALLKAGWHGTDGILSELLQARLLATSALIEVYTRRPFPLAG